MTPERAEGLMRRVALECEVRPRYVLPVHLDITVAIAVIGSLQLALRHPQHHGPSSGVVQGVIDQMIARLKRDGFTATAQIAELGDDPRHDV